MRPARPWLPCHNGGPRFGPCCWRCREACHGLHQLQARMPWHLLPQTSQPICDQSGGFLLSRHLLPYDRRASETVTICDVPANAANATVISHPYQPTRLRAIRKVSGPNAIVPKFGNPSTPTIRNCCSLANVGNWNG